MVSALPCSGYTARMAQSFDLHKAPGHLARRAHQRTVAIFMEEAAAFDVTPVQFAILNALQGRPGEDQITRAGGVALDAATLGAVFARLLARGLGLWDVYDSCERRGSLDSDIRVPQVNDFAALRSKSCQLSAPVADPDGNKAIIRFSRKTKEQYVQTEVNGKATGWKAFFANGKWQVQK